MKSKIEWKAYTIPGAEDTVYQGAYKGYLGTVRKKGGVWSLLLMKDNKTRTPLGIWDSKNGQASGAKAWLEIVVDDESWKQLKGNPTMKTKRKPTPAQLAARERFAEMARSGAFKKAGERKANPVGNLANLKKRYQTLLLTMADLRDDLKRRKKGLPDDEFAQGYSDAELSALIAKYQTKAQDLREAIAMYEGQRKTNPAKVKRNPSSWGTAPLKKVRSVVARSKTTGERRTFMMADSSGVKVPTPYDFGFRLEIEGEMFDFVGRYEGPLLIISEKSTGLRLPGDVGFTLRSSYGDDKNAAKRWTLDLIERVTPQKFAQKVRAAR